MRSLWGSGVPIARALWMDETARNRQPVLRPERVTGNGTEPLRLPADDPEARAIALDLADAAARLHQVDWESLGVDCFLPAVTIAGAARMQVTYWEELFRRQRLEPLPVAVFAFDWLHDHLPPADRVSIVHGDLRFGNLLTSRGAFGAARLEMVTSAIGRRPRGGLPVVVEFEKVRYGRRIRARYGERSVTAVTAITSCSGAS